MDNARHAVNTNRASLGPVVCGAIGILVGAESRVRALLRVMVNRIKAQFQALPYFALDGTDHESRNVQSQMIRH